MDIFNELVRSYGLPVAGPIIAVLIMARVIVVLWNDGRRQMEARIADRDKQINGLQLEIEYLRHRLDLALGLSEAATVTARSFARRRLTDAES